MPAHGRRWRHLQGRGETHGTSSAHRRLRTEDREGQESRRPRQEDVGASSLPAHRRETGLSPAAAWVEAAATSADLHTQGHRETSADQHDGHTAPVVTGGR